MTIRQSPRVDVIPEIHNVLGPDVEIAEKGALDGLNSEDVRKFYPDPNDYILFTRMKDGTEVKVAVRYIIERMRKCVWDFQEAVDVIVLLCTGEFPEIESKPQTSIWWFWTALVSAKGQNQYSEKYQGSLCCCQGQ